MRKLVVLLKTLLMAGWRDHSLWHHHLAGPAPGSAHPVNAADLDGGRRCHHDGRWRSPCLRLLRPLLGERWGRRRVPTSPTPKVFISWGPYKYVRNPMTKGGWTVLCGWGFYQLSPSILLFALLMAAFLHLFIVLVEEPKLERRFGESYREYKCRVNRWFPGWRSLTGAA